jgi:hypothetical protein
MEVADLGLADDDVGRGAEAWSRRVLSLPPAGARAQMLVGSLNEVCARAAEVVRERGGLR